ncbi:MAG: hypothetical protein HWE26_20165 [Alteromonadaceae bacterium]|nr:hypothetical protein [Alteromonadaceae bacterium]
MDNRKLVNVLIFSVITVLLCLASIKALNSTVASLKYYSVKNSIDSWNNGEQPAIEEYKAALINATDTVNYQRDMAFYSDLLAEVLQWGMYFGFENGVESTQADIMDLYNNSIAMRPSWPVTWGNQAFLKWQLQYHNDDISYDLTRANELGVSTPEIHILMTRLGYSFLKSNLSLYLKFNATISHRFELGLRNKLSTSAIIHIVEAKEGTDVGCLWLKQANGPDWVYKKLKCNQ